MRIFLLGFMGTGKTYWGRRWAERYGWRFIDLDQLIEEQEQGSITHIFETKGEDHFREVEAMLLRSMTGEENLIISCGGGTPCFFDNMEWINQQGISVFFDASPGYILNNIQHEERDNRPLLSKINESELLFFIEQKIKERLPFYSRAKMIVNVKELEDNSFETIIQTVNW